ncbi:MAG: hypothetical protein K5657_00690 [Desulfovibrio sp.]|nr:hypothetical protein [Desulfovibrio sp.]
MQSLQDVLLSCPFLLPYYTHGGVSCLFLCVFSIACMGLFFIVGRRLAKKRKRSAYEKGARQLAVLACALGWIPLLGWKAWSYLQSGTLFPESVFGLLEEIAWLMGLVTLLLFSLHLVVWKALSSHPLVSSILSFATFFQGFVWALFVVFLWRLRMPGEPVTLLDLQTQLEQVATGFLGIETPLLCIALPLFLLLLAMPAVYGSMGLLCLRSVHDYGRDHYQTVTRWLSGWIARTGLMLFLLLVLVLGFLLWPAQERLLADPWTVLQPFFPVLLFGLLWLLGSLLHLAVSLSELPLRHKVSVVFADLLLISSVPFYVEMCRMM